MRQEHYTTSPLLPTRKPRIKRTQPESQVVNACIRWLWVNKCFVWRNNTGGYAVPNTNRFIRFGTPGSSDIIGVTRSGRALFVECKSAKGKLSPLQETFKLRIGQHNGIYILARSVDDLIAHAGEILA